MKPRIFIGSSTSGKKVVGALQTAFKKSDCDYDVRPWYQGVFGLSATSIESLESILDNSDFAILILTPDDVVIKKDEMLKAPRDNVILELGLFCGRLGRKRTFVLCQEEAQKSLPSDLFGVTVALFNEHTDNTELLSELNTIVFEIQTAISKIHNEDYLLADLKKSAGRIIKAKAPNFTAELDKTAYVLIPRILPLIYEDDYCDGYERQVVIIPDEKGEEFIIEDTTTRTIFTRKDSFDNPNVTWHRSKINRDNGFFLKFNLDGEDRLEEYKSLREYVLRSERDHYNPYGVKYKPIPYREKKPYHVVETVIESKSKSHGFYKLSCDFEMLTKGADITLQLSGKHANKWVLNVSSFCAFKCRNSPYNKEYKQKDTTNGNVHISFSGWALPGWGYNYLVRPNTED